MLFNGVTLCFIYAIAESFLSQICLGSFTYKMPYDSAFSAVQDGKLRVFNWPGMDIILNEADAHKSVKDVDFRLMSCT